MTTPSLFAVNFLKQPYPTMGLSPSAVIEKTGPTAVQSGSNNTLLKTGQTMWARIASGVPFGFTIDSFFAGKEATVKTSQFVQQKLGEGVQAVNGAVKSSTDGVKGLIDKVQKVGTSAVNYSKWIIVGLVALAVIILVRELKGVLK